ncbi:MAG: glycosyltransferase family 1 protein [Bacteroidales bacterium]|nr:glycosyltransferase family 1 protein [Candidatus Minthousia equi]
MNILFLTYHGFSDISGISKKMLAQIDGLRQCGHKIYVCSYSIREDGHRCRFIDNEVLQDFGCGKLAPIRKRICYNAICKFCIENNISLVYVRSFHNANPFTIRLFKKLRKSGISSVMEIPTYPYDQEYIGANIRTKLGLFIDRIFRKKLAIQMKGIVTFSDAETIFGQRTIRISNGIDFNSIPLRKPIKHEENELHLLGVAEVHYWHGFDRVIKGLAKYYNPIQKIKVYFHIVGGIESATLKEWNNYIYEHNIQKYVVFHGQEFGDKLTDSFNNADFGIGSLARHRSGIDKIKTLKNREYAARGIPFIYSETDDDFENMPYILKAPADESEIEIETIINFYSKCNLSPSAIRDSIGHLSWTYQMAKVIKQL